MCYELASGCLISSSPQCGPATHGSGLTHVSQEARDIQEGLAKLLPELSPEATVFHAKWVRKNVVLYQSNNAFVITETDGLDPVFGRLDEILIVGGDMIVFAVSMCVKPGILIVIFMPILLMLHHIDHFLYS